MADIPAGLPGGAPAEPAKAVEIPALGLVALGAVDALLIIAYVVLTVVAIVALLASQNVPVDVWARMIGQLLGLLLDLALAGFIAYGGWQMKQLQNHKLALIASVVAVIPCFSPCCLVGVPIGIWSILTLNKPEVKAAFKS